MRRCSKVDCQEIASWLPVIALFASPAHGPHPPAEAIFNLPVCDGHKAGVTLDHILTDEGWNQIASRFDLMGKAVPERSRAELRWQAIEFPAGARA